MTTSPRPEATQAAYDQRSNQLAELDARIEAVIGQYRHYGIVVWSEPTGRELPTWRLTDPHRDRDGFAFAHYDATPPAVDVYTREQYVLACAAVDLTPADDNDLGTYADQYMAPNLWDLHPLQVVEAQLRLRRMAGVERETAPARSAHETARHTAAIKAEAVELAAAVAADRHCAECGTLIIRGGMAASFGLACDVDCYDAMADRPGRRGRRARTAPAAVTVSFGSPQARQAHDGDL